MRARGRRVGLGAVAATMAAFVLLVVPSAIADPPVMSLPSDQTLEADSSAGASLTWYPPPVTDDNVFNLQCSYTSNTFPFGATTVHCAAQDTVTLDNTVGSFTITVQDTTPPTVTVPSDITVEATGPSGAAVAYPPATASDVVDGSVPTKCSPASGSTFALGTTIVTCLAKDSNGNTGSNSFNVNVVDTTAPAVTVPAPINTTATGPSTAVTFSASATDLVDGSVPVSCSPPSGSGFPPGTTTVNCSATDQSGNTGTASFTVTVTDLTPPVVTVPAPITAEATGPSGAAVTFSASANDAVWGPVTPSCSPSSGSSFPLGTTTVNCSATDGSGNTGTASFSVTVKDTTPPTVTVPSPITAEATGPAGAPVSFSASASDLVDGNVTPTCAPASGSTFALGTTTVTCTATDSHSNKASASFGVTVQDTTPPTLNGVPGPIVVEADGGGGSRVTFTNPSASDLVDGGVPVSCSPGSNSLFGLGQTTVTCSAIDTHGNRSRASFTVTVQDTTKPALNAPVAATVSSGGAQQLSKSDPKVSAWLAAASAHDSVDGTVPVSNNAPSVLPLGVTVVTFTAVDHAGNTATAQSRLTVVTGSAPPANLDTTPPGEVRKLTIRAGDSYIDLTWALPRDKDFDHVTVTRSVGGSTDGQTVYTGRGTHLRNGHLKNDVTYRYVFVTFDKVGNRSVGIAARAVPKRAALYSPVAGAVLTKPPLLQWARIAGASYYNLQVYRLGATTQSVTSVPGRKVISVWPTGPSYRLTRKWKESGRTKRLLPGRYVWFVWPGYGPKKANRYGTLLGQSTFVLR